MQHFLFNVLREQSVRICVDLTVLRLMLDVSPFHFSFPPHLLVHYLHSSCIQEHEPITVTHQTTFLHSVTPNQSIPRTLSEVCN